MKYLLRIISAIPGILIIKYFADGRVNYMLTLKYILGFSAVVVIAWIVYIIVNYKYGK